MKNSIFTRNLNDHLGLFSELWPLENIIIQATQACVKSLNAGGKIIFCGNGGSAADSQHLASEFTGRFVKDRRPLAAISLTTDTSALTSIANDYSFEKIFERQLDALGKIQDCLIVITTSGNSQNIINVVRIAQKMGIYSIGLLGNGGGALKELCDMSIIVPSETTARIQEAHIFIGHTICGAVEVELGLEH